MCRLRHRACVARSLRSPARTGRNADGKPAEGEGVTRRDGLSADNADNVPAGVHPCRPVDYRPTTLPGGSCDPILIQCNCSCETMLVGNLAQGWIVPQSTSPVDRGTFQIPIALALLDTSEGASHGPRITSMANRHSDSYHTIDLAIRRAARLSVTSNA